MNLKPSQKILFIIFAVIIAIVIFMFYKQKNDNKVKNVLLISIDTCRADHLSCYGYERTTTPNIDAFAKEGILFEKTISPVPLTLAAHSSMLTGTIPPYHGIHDNLDYSLSESNITIAEILKEKGFSTGAAVSTYVLDSRFGIDQGFDYYEDNVQEKLNPDSINERKAEQTSLLAMDWLSEHKDERFFFFLHYYDPHEEYIPPEPFASEYKDNLYAGEIAYTDFWIGKILDKLKELNLYDSTLIIITGDHGEGLGEHEESTHAFYVYHSTIHVPMIFRIPKLSPKRIDDLTGLIDIVPTICSILKIKIPSYMQGSDLSPYFNNENYTIKDRIYYSESMIPTKYGANSLLAVTDRQYKYIQTTRPELYDLIEDPEEVNNLISSQSNRGRIMQDKLSRILEESVRTNNEDSRVQLDAEARKRLESLGYVAGRISENFQFDQSKQDPKDIIYLYETNLKVAKLAAFGKFEEAKKLCRKLSEQHPDQLFLDYKLGKIYFKEGDMKEAVNVFNSFLIKATRMYPGKILSDPAKSLLNPGTENDIVSDTHHKLGVALSKLNKLDEALEHFNKALMMTPNEPEIYCNLGNALFEHDRYEEALEKYNKALELGPTNEEYLIIHEGLANVYIKLNKSQQAIDHLREVLKKKPDQPEKLNNLGILLSDQGQNDEAIESWKKSLQINNEQHNVHMWLGNKIYDKGKINEAIDHWSESLRLDPNQPALQAKLGKVFLMQGQVEKTLKYWDKALALKPDMPELLNDFAWILATNSDPTIKNPKKALDMALLACESADFENANFLDTLSVAYAANNDFPNAIKTIRKAINLAAANNQTQQEEKMKKRLDLYKTGKQYSK